MTIHDYVERYYISNNVVRLNCSHNDITSLEGIENLTNLRKLSCNNNRLRSLEGIENCTNL